MCLGDTSLQTLQWLQKPMSENGHEPVSFPDRIIFTRVFNDVTDCRSKQVQGKCLDSAREVATYVCSKIQTWLLVFLWTRIGTDLEIQRVKANFSHFAVGLWCKLASVMICLRGKFEGTVPLRSPANPSEFWVHFSTFFVSFEFSGD